MGSGRGGKSGAAAIGSAALAEPEARYCVEELAGVSPAARVEARSRDTYAGAVDAPVACGGPAHVGHDGYRAGWSCGTPASHHESLGEACALEWVALVAVPAGGAGRDTGPCGARSRHLVAAPAGSGMALMVVHCHCAAAHTGPCGARSRHLVAAPAGSGMALMAVHCRYAAAEAGHCAAFGDAMDASAVVRWLERVGCDGNGAARGGGADAAQPLLLGEPQAGDGLSELAGRQRCRCGRARAARHG